MSLINFNTITKELQAEDLKLELCTADSPEFDLVDISAVEGYLQEIAFCIKDFSKVELVGDTGSLEFQYL